MQEENSREQQEREERSIGELFAELLQKTTTLVRQEIELAKVEMSQKASRVGKNVGFLVIGGVVAYTGLLAVVGGDHTAGRGDRLLALGRNNRGCDRCSGCRPGR